LTSNGGRRADQIDADRWLALETIQLNPPDGPGLLTQLLISGWKVAASSMIRALIAIESIHKSFRE